eukprot:TRINITY_DN4497_c0_g2_i1.p1 TRINITY_DN4497_c0_g2~~TRINITY_DN4497_c0_g2_i1.p1  ORF type:complete len:224 (-),score=48.56 TRINITY_DN4497_c0_g2_i1:63-680(-)
MALAVRSCKAGRCLTTKRNRRSSSLLLLTAAAVALLLGAAPGSNWAPAAPPLTFASAVVGSAPTALRAASALQQQVGGQGTSLLARRAAPTRSGADFTAEAVQPLGDQVLVEEIRAPAESRGGVLLAESARQKSQVVGGLRLGRIRAKGAVSAGASAEAAAISSAVALGDTVLFQDFEGHKLQDHTGNNLYLIHIGSIKAKLSST